MLRIPLSGFLRILVPSAEVMSDKEKTCRYSLQLLSCWSRLCSEILFEKVDMRKLSCFLWGEGSHWLFIFTSPFVSFNIFLKSVIHECSVHCKKLVGVALCSIECSKPDMICVYSRSARSSLPVSSPFLMWPSSSFV